MSLGAATKTTPPSEASHCRPEAHESPPNLSIWLNLLARTRKNNTVAQHRGTIKILVAKVGTVKGACTQLDSALLDSHTGHKQLFT